MKWADFEAEKKKLKEDLNDVQKKSRKVSSPQKSLRGQIDDVTEKQNDIKESKGKLEDEISDCFKTPEELDHVSVPWDMPDTPKISKRVLRTYNNNMSKNVDSYDSFEKEWLQRTDVMKDQWSTFDD